jgi:hypothetical protein
MPSRSDLLAGTHPALWGLVGYILLPVTTGAYTGGLSFRSLVFDALFTRSPTFHLLALVLPGFVGAVAVVAGRQAADGNRADVGDALALVVAVPTGTAVAVAVGLTDGLV